MKKKMKKKILTKNRAKNSAKVSKKKPMPNKLSAKPLIKSSIKPVSPDPAHSPGHKKLGKLDKLDQFGDHGHAKVVLQESALKNASNADIIKKHNSRHRRIITGAALGKTGRIVIK